MDNIYITDKLKKQTYLFGPPANVYVYQNITIQSTLHIEAKFKKQTYLLYTLHVQQSTFIIIFRLLLIQLDK